MGASDPKACVYSFCMLSPAPSLSPSPTARASATTPPPRHQPEWDRPLREGPCCCPRSQRAQEKA